VNDRISINRSQNPLEIFIEPKESDKKRLFDPLIEEEIPFLPERKDPIRSLNQVGVLTLCEAKKLSTLQGVSEGKGMNP